MDNKKSSNVLKADQKTKLLPQKRKANRLSGSSSHAGVVPKRKAKGSISHSQDSATREAYSYPVVATGNTLIEDAQVPFTREELAVTVTTDPELELPAIESAHTVPSDSLPEKSLLGELLQSGNVKQPITTTDQPVISVSESPVKKDPGIWIANLNLYRRDKSILESSTEWLTDNIIEAALLLLKKQSKKHHKRTVHGWMSPQLSKREQLFDSVKPNSPFVQIVHKDGHWITVSNIDTANKSHFNDSVTIYDSGYPSSISFEMKRIICSIMQPQVDTLHFDVANVQAQPNGSDCGVFAIAFATELAYGCDPTRSNFMVDGMRQHLISCLEGKEMFRFPCSKQRRIPLGSRVIQKKSVKEAIYCSCRMINDKRKPMIVCDSCKKYLHMECEGLDPTKSYKDVKWCCSACASSKPMASCSS